MNFKKSVLTFFISILISTLILLFNCNEPSSSKSSGGDTEEVPSLPVETKAWVDDGEGFIQFYTNDTNNCGIGFFTNIAQVYDSMQSVEFEVKKNSGSPYVGYGIIFCVQDSDNFYRLLIVNAGYYIISKKVGGNYIPIIEDWFYTGNLNQGNGAINNIKVARDNTGKFTVYFNNNQTYTFTDATFAGGDCGYYAGIGPSNYESFPNTPVDVRFKFISGEGFPPIPPSSSKEITSFKFTSALNPGFTSDSTGSIIGTNINILIPHTADINNLIATFNTTGKSVMIGLTAQESEITSNNFTNPVTYTIIAEDGSSQEYIVNVSKRIVWGSYGSGNGQFTYPTDIAIDSSGNVYVVDSNNNRIQKFDSSGNYIAQWGSLGSSIGQLTLPSAIAIDCFDNIYVAEPGHNRVIKFNSNGEYINKWGKTGSGDGEFLNPNGIEVDISCNVYVSDSSNCRIQKFDSIGTYLGQWGSYGSGDGQFELPIGIIVNSSGNILVADSGNDRVQKFDSSGTYLGQWGDSGSGNGKFNDIYGIAIDSSGNIFVSDKYNYRIQKFDTDGNYLTQMGSLGSQIGYLNDPHGVAVDSSGNVYIADFGNNRIQVFPASFISSLNFSKSNISFSKQNISSSKKRSGNLWQGKDNNINNLELSNQGKSK